MIHSLKLKVPEWYGTVPVWKKWAVSTITSWQFMLSNVELNNSWKMDSTIKEILILQQITSTRAYFILYLWGLTHTLPFHYTAYDWYLQCSGAEEITKVHSALFKVGKAFNVTKSNFSTKIPIYMTLFIGLRFN